jgi:hypothetical protein
LWPSLNRLIPATTEKVAVIEAMFRRPFCHSDHMDDWFNDPFFTPARPAPADIQNHFTEMHHQMNNFVESVFGHFRDLDRHFGLTHDGGQKRPAIEDHSSTRPSDQSRLPPLDNRPARHPTFTEGGTSPTRRSFARPIVEEPDTSRGPSSGSGRASDGRQQSFFYASAMTSATGPDGLQHAQRKTYNSATGTTEMAEMRRIGDQAVAVRREVAADGTTKDQIDRQNLNESELGSFRQRWDSRRSELPRLIVGSGATSPPRRALK